jgi:(p)ppGpp synthase/HD superfamily hydrolase
VSCRREPPQNLWFVRCPIDGEDPEVAVMNVGSLLEALRFSAEKHRDQRRKGVHASPYINHPIEVAAMLANVAGVRDDATLIAAVLHDTIEDTRTTPEEIEAAFGTKIRSIVLEVTDDKRLPKAERKRLQVEHAPHMSSSAKLIKIADKISNVSELTVNPPSDWSLERRREYLGWAEQVVAGCRGVNDALESKFDEALRAARAVI